MTSADDLSASSLVGAVDWLRTLLLGEAGTAVAIIAVAAVGALMLLGRAPVRRGVTVVIGCFILFGAGSIANGLLTDSARLEAAALPAPAAQPSYQATVPKPQPYDPYAGASVPTQQPSTGLLPR